MSRADPYLLPPGRAALILGVTPAVLGQWADNHQIRCVRDTAGQRMYYESEMYAILDAGKTGRHWNIFMDDDEIRMLRADAKAASWYRWFNAQKAGWAKLRAKEEDRV